MKNIIIAGCGGGCDIFGGIPLYMSLTKKTDNIILTNLSFTKKSLLDTLGEENIKKLTSSMYEIMATNEKEFDYFPEYLLSFELKKKIYVILKDCSIEEIINNYNYLINMYKNIYYIYLIDGGCDAFLSGKETGLGSPVEDMMHMKAVSYLDIQNKYLCAVGMNVDVGHGVIETELIERLDELEKNNILLEKKVWSFDEKYIKNYYDISKKLGNKSIVHTLVCASLEGNCGNFLPLCIKKRVKKSIVELSILTKTFCTFNFEELIKSIIYFNYIQINMNRLTVEKAINDYLILTSNKTKRH